MTSAISVAMTVTCPDDVDWEGLSASISPEHQFLSKPWYLAWALAFLPMERWRGPLRWVVARHATDGVTGIIPFAEQRLGPLSTLSLGGYYWPFRAIPFNSDMASETARAIVNWAHSNSPSTVWRLGPTPRGSPALEAVIGAFSEGGWTVVEKQVGETYAIKAVGGFDAYERSMAHLIKKVAYYERRMNRSGNVHIGTGPAGGEMFRRQLLRDLEAVEARSWVTKNDGGKPKFVGERNKRFWTHLAESVVFDTIRPMILYIDDRPISYSLNIDAGTTRYIVANGYDDEFNSNSPGMVLAYHVLRDASRCGRSIVEWGQGDSGYKSRWGAVEHLKLVDLLILPRSPVGYLAFEYLKRKAGYARIR